MDSVNISAAVSQYKTNDAVSTLVLKKALDVQEQSAKQMIEALPQQQYTNPSHLGSRIDAKA